MSLYKTFGSIAFGAALKALEEYKNEGQPDTDNTVPSEPGNTQDAQQTSERKSKDVVKVLSGGKISTEDLRKLREGLNKVPALHGEAVTKALLDTSVFTIQMGQATVLITYDDNEGLMANAMKMETISIKKTNEVAGSDKFSSMVLKKGETEDEPNLHLVTNKELLSGNRRKIAAAFILNGVALPDDNIPGLSSIVSGLTGGISALSERFKKGATAESDITADPEPVKTQKAEPPAKPSPWNSSHDSSAPK